MRPTKSSLPIETVQNVQYNNSKPPLREYHSLNNPFADKILRTPQCQAFKVCSDIEQAVQEVAVAKYLKPASIQKHPGGDLGRAALDSLNLGSPL
ncbi:hypothetical protein E4U41_006009 [Claviceps citrina]|nr:hypothetical protein E4U41_006009 [Claviceps citrina]